MTTRILVCLLAVSISLITWAGMPSNTEIETPRVVSQSSSVQTATQQGKILSEWQSVQLLGGSGIPQPPTVKELRSNNPTFAAFWSCEGMKWADTVKWLMDDLHCNKSAYNEFVCGKAQFGAMPWPSSVTMAYGKGCDGDPMGHWPATVTKAEAVWMPGWVLFETPTNFIHVARGCRGNWIVSTGTLLVARVETRTVIVPEESPVLCQPIVPCPVPQQPPCEIYNPRLCAPPTLSTFGCLPATPQPAVCPIPSCQPFVSQRLIGGGATIYVAPSYNEVAVGSWFRSSFKHRAEYQYCPPTPPTCGPTANVPNVHTPTNDGHGGSGHNPFPGPNDP